MRPVLLIAPIGSPYTWREVEYIIPWGSTRIKARTSVKAILQELRSRGNQPFPLAFALDTLSAAPRMIRGREIEHADCLPDPYKDLPSGEIASDDYKEFMNRIEQCVSVWFREVEGISLETVVLPGIGSYNYTTISGELRRASWSIFEYIATDHGYTVRPGPMEYLMAYQTLHVISKMEDIFKGGNASVHVDLTHGVNYANYSLYRATLFASRLYSASHYATVDLTIYNSEPYMRGIEKLNVWIMKREVIQPRAAASRLVYTSIAQKSGERYASLRINELLYGVRDALSSFNKIINSNLNKMKYLNSTGWPAATAIIIGAPLLLAQTWVTASEIGLEADSFKKISTALLEILPQVSISKNNKSMPATRITHKIILNYNQLKKLLALLALTLYSKHSFNVKGVSQEQKTSKLSKSCKKAKVAVATLEALEIIAKNMIVGPSREIISNELSNFRRAAKGEKTAPEYMLARRALSECAPAEYIELKKQIFSMRGINKRIFIAHAGLTSEIITVEAECHNASNTTAKDSLSTIKFYYDPCLLSKISKVSQEIMEDLAEQVFGTSNKLTTRRD